MYFFLKLIKFYVTTKNKVINVAAKIAIVTTIVQ